MKSREKIDYFCLICEKRKSENRKKIENRKKDSQSQNRKTKVENRKTKNENRNFFQSRRPSRFLFPEGEKLKVSSTGEKS